MQPAPRIAIAPMANSARCQRFGIAAPPATAASPLDQAHGQNSSHAPIGRSARARRRNGRHGAGAIRSTQFEGAASATAPEEDVIMADRQATP